MVSSSKLAGGAIAAVISSAVLITLITGGFKFGQSVKQHGGALVERNIDWLTGGAGIPSQTDEVVGEVSLRLFHGRTRLRNTMDWKGNLYPFSINIRYDSSVFQHILVRI